jgi:tetratricopeptide (TPR) repeat protein
VGDIVSNKAIRWHSRKLELVWAAAALLLALWLCYSDSFHASWQYDDYKNILDNPDVHMTDLSWPQIARTFRTGLSHQIISRPLAFLSFALNYRFGQSDVFGYHLVNFTIHWLTSLVLFLFVRDTLRLPIFDGRYAANAAIIAWLAALVWAVHPIQVTAVTYIVQRMASLAGFFYILSIYLYQLGRRCQRPRDKMAAFCTSALAALGAMLTKENAVLLIPAIVLYEAMMIQGVNRRSIRQGALLTVVAAIIIALIGLLYMDPAALLEPYDNRPFSKLERLMTQPRVLFFYISLLALPMISRLTILHDVTISHSLLDPWTTLAAIGGWCVVLILAVMFCRRYPLFSFCVLFFLLNHSIEASFLNLEMVYEHRNYIPSMMAFVPLAVFARHAAVRLSYHKVLPYAVWFCVASVCLSFGYTTFAYNRMFSTEWSLWSHAVRRAPLLSLTHSNLGNTYWNAGLRGLALDEFKKAFDLDRYTNLYQKGLVLYNLGLHDAYETGDHAQALDRFRTAKTYYAGSPVIWYQTALMHTVLGDYGAASNEVEAALEYWPRKADLHYLSGMVFLRQRRCGEALNAAAKALSHDPDHLDSFALSGGAHQCHGDYEAAIESWMRLIERKPDHLLGLLALIELHDRVGAVEGAKRFIERLHAIVGQKPLEEMIALAMRDVAASPYIPDKARLSHALSQ